MSYLIEENGGIVFYDAFNKPQKLIELNNPAENRSDLLHAMLLQEIHNTLPKLFDQTFESIINIVIFLRVVKKLMNKPQIHSVLKIGQLSPLDMALAEILPKFNKKNSLYCYTAYRPVGNFNNVNFIHVIHFFFQFLYIFIFSNIFI